MATKTVRSLPLESRTSPNKSLGWCVISAKVQMEWQSSAKNPSASFDSTPNVQTGANWSLSFLTKSEWFTTSSVKVIVR
jgi:hypothetical protein